MPQIEDFSRFELMIFDSFIIFGEILNIHNSERNHMVKAVARGRTWIHFVDCGHRWRESGFRASCSPPRDGLCGGPSERLSAGLSEGPSEGQARLIEHCSNRSPESAVGTVVSSLSARRWTTTSGLLVAALPSGGTHACRYLQE